jgi:FlgD Ig-like domain
VSGVTSLIGALIHNPSGLAPEDHGGAQMQYRMKALLVALLFGLASTAMLVLDASADAVLHSRFEQELRTRAARLRPRTSAAGDPDTVWIGHVNTNTGLPGSPGGAGPNHVGRGAHLLVGGALGSAADFNGTWDFDHFQSGETDSLMGWWPITLPFQSIGPTNFDDNLRPWFSMDYGNQGSYVLPQGSPKRTFGVIGYWHRDPGNLAAPLPNPDAVPGPNPEWAPLAGTASAWCGLRAGGDNTVIDGVTGNAINANVLQYFGDISGNQIGSVRTQGTDNNFPGYGAQWDQMMYRDVTFAANASGNVTISFKYTTNMSLGQSGNHAGQAGWFDKDPLKQAAVGDGNYRSVNALNLVGQSLVDSFMVYIGAPVDDANCQYSNGSVLPVYDPLRRWFSEVVKINTPGTTYKQLLSVSGVQGSAVAPINGTWTVPQALVNGILDADGGANNGGRLRLVFRVKTNRGSDDQNSGNTPAENDPDGAGPLPPINNTGSGKFSSLTRGAAIIDDVSVSGGGATTLTSGFESASEVDNNQPATVAWKSTGKPPAAWFHVHRLDDLTQPLPFTDPCGTLTASVRFCNMTGAVLVPGNHDNSDKSGGLYGGNLQDQQKAIVSPTVNLCSNAVGDYNAMGIDADIAGRSPILVGDYMHNLYNYPNTGNGFRLGWQCYPATQENGAKVWGELTKSIFFGFWENLGCFEELLTDAKAELLYKTTNVSGKADSIRVYIESMARCLAVAGTVSAIACSPTSGVFAGGYFDNLSMGFAKAPPPASVSATFATQFQDCFPVNGQNKTVSAFGPAYDTLAVRMQSSYNIAPTTGVATGAGARENIPGDSALADAPGNNVRVDLVFRILPGPGNYVQIGNRASGVARRPDQNPRVLALGSDPGAAIPNASKFWGAYIADNGAYGTGGNGTSGPGHGGPGANGVSWDINKWNSARMDTTELNFFPATGVVGDESTSRLSPGSWMTMYNELDPKFATLGVDKNRCFLENLSKRTGDINVNCGNLNGHLGEYPPASPGLPYQSGGTAIAASGLKQSENGLALGHTYEFSKILPDGQFTPGTEVQYFYRKSTVGDVVAFDMSPDTNFIFPQGETFGYFDFHRWRDVEILPDRWKDPAFGAGGSGMACMLVVDIGERRGDLGYWIATADSMGLTSVAKRGAHNGWRARPDQNWAGVNVGSDDSICRRDNGGQPGSLFDKYSQGGAESNVSSGHIGSRGAQKNNGGGSLSINKWSTHGPSEDMVKNYRHLVVLGADVGDEGIGPRIDETDDDIGLFTSFLTLPGGSAQPRGFQIWGQKVGTNMDSFHPTFMSTFLRATLRNENYLLFTGDNALVTDLVVMNPVTPTASYTFGVFNQCFLNNDILNVLTTAPAGQAGAYYHNVANGYVASVYAPESGGSRPFKTLYNGWTFGLFGGMGTQTTGLNVGTRKYVYDELTSAFGSLGCNPTGNPVGVGDGNGSGRAFVNFMNLKSSNPMHSGEARIAFGLAKTERVQINVFDVTGRLLKTVADRTFAAGQEHVVTWDGTNNSGGKVKSGVYFYQLKANSWTSQKKLAVLAN